MKKLIDPSELPVMGNVKPLLEEIKELRKEIRRLREVITRFEARPLWSPNGDPDDHD